MKDLIELAFAAREKSYSPYSKYKVGAAIKATDGVTYLGCNVENVSYGLCICAERVALTKMVSEGHQEIAEVAVATRDGGTPCGMCVQSLMEFSKEPRDVLVHTCDESGNRQTYRLSELMPHAFTSKDLG